MATPASQERAWPRSMLCDHCILCNQKKNHNRDDDDNDNHDRYRIHDPNPNRITINT